MISNTLRIRKLKTANQQGDAPASRLQSLHAEAKRNLESTKKLEASRQAKRLKGN